MRKSAIPFGPDDHMVKNYFPVPNSVFTLGLSTGALVTQMYRTLQRRRGTLSAEALSGGLGKSVRTVTGYLQELEKCGVACTGQKASGNFFLMSKTIFDLGLSLGAIATYAYLMRCENRESHQCWPSMATIGEQIGKTRKSVMAYVRELEEKQLIYTEHSTVWGKDGQKRNANLICTIRPIADAKRYHYEQQVLMNERWAAENRAA